MYAEPLLLLVVVVLLDPSQLQSLAESCVGYVPADLQALVREAHLQVSEEPIQ